MSKEDLISKASEVREVAQTLCKICGESLREKPIVLCKRCQTPHHNDCWHYNEGCATFGCGSRIFRQERPSDGLVKVGDRDSISYSFEIGYQYTGWDTLIFALSFLTLIIGFILMSTFYYPGPTVILVGLSMPLVLTFFRSLQGSITAQQTTIDPLNGYIHLFRTIKGKLAHGHQRIAMNELQELQLTSHYEVFQNPKPMTIHRLMAICKDGSAVQIWRQNYKMDQAELEAWVERLSFAASTTVRFIEEDEKAPPEDEIPLLTALQD